MISALLFLQIHSVKNRLLLRIRRMKQPKYLFGAIVGGLYFYSVFFRNVAFARYSNGSQPSFSSEFEPVAALVFFVILFLGWLLPHERAALTFSEAEIAFLFPAPVSRNGLIHFKLLRSQFTVLFSTIFLAFLSRRSGNFAIRALGWWTILSTMNLHFIGASFARTMLLDRGITNARRRVIVMLVVGALAAGVFWWCKHAIPAPSAKDLASLSSLGYFFRHAVQSGPLPYLLAPFQMIVHPFFTNTLPDFALAMIPALMLMAAHYLWVMWSNVSFEEASINKSQKVAERVASIRSGKARSIPTKKKRAPFRLAPIGNPAVAIMWKNLMGVSGGMSWRFLIPVMIFGFIFMSNGRHGDWLSLIGMLLVMFFVISLVLGAQFVRQDFRHDLPMMDVLKTFPMAAWQIVLGELLASVVVLTAVQWIVLLVAVAVLEQGFGLYGVGIGSRMVFAASLAVLCPMLNTISLLIPNAAVLMFPGWFQHGKDGPPQGIEAMGQRLIFSIGQFLVFGLSLVPAGAVFAGVFFLLTTVGVMTIIAVLLSSIVAAAVLGGEAALGVMLLAKLFRKYDVSSE